VISVGYWAAGRLRAPNTSEVGRIEELRAALAGQGSQGKALASHELEFGFYDGLGRMLHARCRRCLQMVFAEFNPDPRPLLRGRWSWQPILLRGLPSLYFCGYLISLGAVFREDPYR
jgi:hypothetical protein